MAVSGLIKDGWYSEPAVNRFLKENLEALGQSITDNKKDDILKYQKEILIADFTNWNRKSIYKLVYILNSKLGDKADVVISGGDGFNFFIAQEYRAVSPDIDVKVVLKIPEILPGGRPLESSELISLISKNPNNINSIRRKYMEVINIVTETMAGFAKTLSEGHEVRDDGGNETTIFGEGRKYNNRGLLDMCEEILRTIEPALDAVLMEEILRKLNKPIGRDDDPDLKYKIGSSWAVRINEMRAGRINPETDPYTLNNVKLIALDLRYANHKSYYSCLAGVLDVVITIPGHMGFMVEGQNYDNEQDGIEFVGGMMLNSITSDYYIHESFEMIKYGLRSKNGKIIKDYNRFAILLESDTLSGRVAANYLEELASNVTDCERSRFSWPIEKLQEKHRAVIALIAIKNQGGGAMAQGGNCLCDATTGYVDYEETHIEYDKYSSIDYGPMDDYFLENLYEDYINIYMEKLEEDFHIPDEMVDNLTARVKGIILEEKDDYDFHVIETEASLVRELAMFYDRVEDRGSDGGGGGIKQSGGHPDCLIEGTTAEDIEEGCPQSEEYPDNNTFNVNSGSMGSSLTKKLNIYDYLLSCGVDLNTDLPNWFRNNLQLTTDGRNAGNDLNGVGLREGDFAAQLGTNFEKLQNGMNLGDSMDDYITSPLKSLFQVDGDTIDTVGFECRNILRKISERACMIKLLDILIEKLDTPIGRRNIHYLAQFRSFERGGIGGRQLKIYAKYIYLNLINSFNPYKLYKQKSIFGAKIKSNPYNSILFNRICKFYNIIKELATTGYLITEFGATRKVSKRKRRRRKCTPKTPKRKRKRRRKSEKTKRRKKKCTSIKRNKSKKI